MSIPVSESQHDLLDGLFSDHESCASDCASDYSNISDCDDNNIVNVYNGEESEDEFGDEDEDTEDEDGVEIERRSNANNEDNESFYNGDKEDSGDREDCQENLNQECGQVELCEDQEIHNQVDTVFESAREQALTGSTEQQPAHFGYTLTMDNIDMNVRRSFQRCDRSTESYHFSHVFAAQNCVDDSELQDGSTSGDLSPEVILPNKADWQKIVSDFEVLVSR